MFYLFAIFVAVVLSLCKRSGGYGLSDVDAISRHSVSVVAQLPHIRAFINGAKEPFWDVRQYHLLFKSWHVDPNVFTSCAKTIMNPLIFKEIYLTIHSKSWISWMEKSADDFEFSAERLSENAKSIKITLVAELLPVISPIYVQSLQ